MARIWELSGIPHTSMSEPGGIANAIAVLRENGLAERLAEAGAEDAGDLSLAPPSGERGPSGLLNERGIAALVEATEARVIEALGRGRLPLLVGGDCPVLLGALASLREHGRPGLLMLDGHEDAWPPQRSPTGEASDSEIAIALGWVTGLPRRLARRLPLLDRSALAYVGPRDSAELAEEGIGSLRADAAFFADAAEASAALRNGRDPAAEAVAALHADVLWLHIDLDVLDEPSFRAVDYRQPGGLSWDELARLSLSAMGRPGCRGVSVAIYNPDLDPDRKDATKLIEFLSRLVASGMP